ncbi:Pentatricopeptide repeat-containing protein [Nymphaea thermarum]|nr:Pentatricopeptide repeat-containing protein [Nymphaea thermarum]
MQSHASEKGGGSLYTYLLDRCIKGTNLKLGRSVHAALIKTALYLNVFLANRLVEVYAKCNSVSSSRRLFDEMPERNAYTWNTIIGGYARNGLLVDAQKLFNQMPERNVVTWNSMISGLARCGNWEGAIGIFRSLQKEKMWIDKFTLVSLLNLCSRFKVLEWVRQIHGAVVVMGLKLNLIMLNSFIDAYGKCGDLGTSKIVFDRMEERDVISWTSMFSSYAQLNQLEEARQLFERMPVKNEVSWTALITGHSQNDQGEKALELFSEMQKEFVLPTAFTFVGVLSACSSLGLIECGKQLHGHIMRTMPEPNIFISNALIDMYAKCGCIGSALIHFKQMCERDIVSWNALITGFAQNGCARESLEIFDRMSTSGVKPNDVTFLGVLAACSHAGLVSEGHQYWILMETHYGVRPRSDHYAAMIDLLGRSGRLNEAVELLKSISSQPDVGMWGALLGACLIHGNADLASEAAESLFSLEPTNVARYVSLSNVYAGARRWNHVSQLRVLIKERGMKKQPALSWIEIRNRRHYFAPEDKTHYQIEEIYEMLDLLTCLMKEAG